MICGTFLYSKTSVISIYAIATLVVTQKTMLGSKPLKVIFRSMRLPNYSGQDREVFQKLGMRRFTITASCSLGVFAEVYIYKNTTYWHCSAQPHLA